MEQQTIAVLGSGVQGLTTALLLLHQGAKKVVVIANASVAEYDKKDSCFASPKAGANWQTFAGDNDHRLQEYDEATYYTLWSLSFLPQCGIMRLPGFQFFDEKPADFKHPWYSRFVKNYAYATATDLPPSKKFGIKYETVTMNVPQYLTWLASRVKAMGGTFIVKKLNHWEDALKDVDASIVVNCTGFGSMKLGGVEDKDMYPARGQVVIVRAPQVQRTIGSALSLGSYRGNSAEAEAKVTYVIPREDGLVILGGTYQKGNHSMEIDQTTAQNIMERCVAICPELVVNGKLPEIVEHSVGLRPARYGDCRLDSQYLKSSTGKDVLFVNNYGHGGYGYQSSWGCAQSVVRMVRRAIGISHDDKILTKLLKETVAAGKNAKL
ncbi:FAD dependent oxidoreductase [Obelidium mucronatum]|nr:FAD dependent oxidoreductase [Obelidium mucronatum]